MIARVPIQIRFLAKRLVARDALEGPLLGNIRVDDLRVRLQVAVQIGLLKVGLLTQMAFKMPGSSMQTLVTSQIGLLEKRLGTLAATMRSET